MCRKTVDVGTRRRPANILLQLEHNGFAVAVRLVDHVLGGSLAAMNRHEATEVDLYKGVEVLA